MTDDLKNRVCSIFMLAFAGSASVRFGTMVKAYTEKPLAGPNHGKKNFDHVLRETGKEQ
jgi:hypothetical protein